MSSFVGHSFDISLLKNVQQSVATSVYGTRRIVKILAKNDIFISRKRIGKLIKSAGLFCKTKHRFKVTTDSRHNKPIAPNLLARQFDVENPDKYCVGNITYIPTKNGWLYLATVIDLYSRQVIGWSMADNMKAKLVNDALTQWQFEKENRREG